MPIHNATVQAHQRFINSCGANVPIPANLNYLPNFPTSYSVIILAYALAVAIFYSFILVALFRLAKSTPTFIIFLSHGINDTAVLFTGDYHYLERLLGITFFSPCERIERIIVSFLFFSTFIHLLLIAINRGVSMHFPLAYAWIWTRMTCLLAVAACWALTALCNAIVIAEWVVYKELRMLMLLFNLVVKCSIYASMAIYASVIFRKALGRVFCCRERSRVGEDASRHQPVSSSSPLEDKARVRLFVYAIVTSIPVMIMWFGIPTITPLFDENLTRFIFRFDLISMSLLSSGLLCAMSKQVRENTPLFGKLCSASATITPANTTASAIITHHEGHEGNWVSV